MGLLKASTLTCFVADGLEVGRRMTGRWPDPVLTGSQTDM
jgi:hypothetical protein